MSTKHDYLHRDITKHVNELRNMYPVLTITGPRQSGKTTMVKNLFPDKKYLNLEDLELFEYALKDPKGFIQDISEGAIIDEIQKAPQLLSYIQLEVDKTDKKSHFILTSSQNLLLLNTVTQSLAGRTALLSLLPFSINELRKDSQDYSSEEYIFNGFYPRVYRNKINPNYYYRDYIKTYLERDLRTLKAVHDLSLFHKFLKLCAGRVGQLLNYQSLSEDLGIASGTVREWISLLETSYIIFLLEPFSANINKRLIKSPKIYFYDTGLVRYLLDITDIKQLKTHHLKGALFENLIILEFMKSFYNSGLDPSLYFYRDKAKELDLIIKKAENSLAIEIKSAKTFHDSFLENLNYYEKLFPENTESLGIIYDGDLDQKRKNIEVISFNSLNKFIKKAII